MNVRVKMIGSLFLAIQTKGGDAGSEKKFQVLQSAKIENSLHVWSDLDFLSLKNTSLLLILAIWIENIPN